MKLVLNCFCTYQVEKIVRVGKVAFTSSERVSLHAFVQAEVLNPVQCYNVIQTAWANVFVEVLFVQQEKSQVHNYWLTRT